MSQIPYPQLPFNLPLNAELTLSRESGKYTEDPSTGNQIPQISYLGVRASLTRILVGSRFDEDPGQDSEFIQIQGYIIDPPSTFRNFKLGGTVPCVIHDLNAQTTYPGEFRFNRVITPFNVALGQIGVPIRGYFKLIESRFSPLTTLQSSINLAISVSAIIGES